MAGNDEGQRCDDVHTYVKKWQNLLKHKGSSYLEYVCVFPLRGTSTISVKVMKEQSVKYAF